MIGPNNKLEKKGKKVSESAYIQEKEKSRCAARKDSDKASKK